jgi:hypothetical protein
LRILGNIVRKELQGDKAVKLYVLGFIDHAHPTAAQLLDDAEVGYRSPGEWGRIGHCREFYAAPNGKSTRRSSAHYSFAYSVLAAMRMGMSGSASFQSVRKSL